MWPRATPVHSAVIIDWLKAQQKAMGDTVESIFILDDIVGFVNEEHYLEFAHPYLKRICDAFPKDWVKLYHNDAEVDACLDHLPDCGFNVLNWGKQKDIREVKARVGKRMCLMGNVNPLEIAVRGTPADVKAATHDVLEGAFVGHLMVKSLALNAVYFAAGWAVFAYFLQSARIHGTLVQMGE